MCRQFKKFRYLVAGLACVLTAFVFAEDAHANGEVVWLDSYPRALEQARASGKPILLAFRCVP